MSTVRELARILGTDGKRASQRTVARFLGVTQKSVSDWTRGKVSKPQGVPRFFILIACKVGETSPEVVRATLDLEPGHDGFNRIARVVGGRVRAATLLGVTGRVVADWEHEAEPLYVRRLARFLEWVEAVAPGLINPLK